MWLVNRAKLSTQQACFSSTDCESFTDWGNNKNTVSRAWLQIKPCTHHRPTVPSLTALNIWLKPLLSTKSLIVLAGIVSGEGFFFQWILHDWSSRLYWLYCSPISLVTLFTLASAIQLPASLPLTDIKCKHTFVLLCWMNSMQYKGPEAPDHLIQGFSQMWEKAAWAHKLLPWLHLFAYLLFKYRQEPPEPGGVFLDLQMLK